MKFSIKDFFSKYDQTHSFLRIWSHLLRISLTESFNFCEVHNILRLFDILPNYPFTTSEMMRDYFL